MDKKYCESNCPHLCLMGDNTTGTSITFTACRKFSDISTCVFLKNDHLGSVKCSQCVKTTWIDNHLYNHEKVCKLPFIRVKLLTSSAKIPRQSTPGSSGYDLFADESVVIAPGFHRLVNIGISIEIPFGYEGQVRFRSGLASHYGVVVLNSPGTLDSDYRGAVKVMLQNFGSSQFEVNKGDRIAQLVIAKVEHMSFEAVEDLSETSRGDKGFGSTGV